MSCFTHGVAVEANLAALRWGRAQVADPEALRAALPGTVGAETPSPAELPEVIEQRITAVAGSGVATDHLRLLASELIAWRTMPSYSG